MKNNSQKSLFYILGVIVTTVVVTVMATLLTYNYNETKKEIEKELNENAQITLTRITNSFAHFIEAYSINEYVKLIVNEMGDKDILAIVVEDYLSGEIMGEGVLFSGKVRDHNWNLEVFDLKNNRQSTSIQNSYMHLSSDIFSTQNIRIGKVNLYYTNKYINEQLASLAKKSFLITFAVSALLILFLFLSIKRNILNPVDNIVQALLNKGKDGLPKDKIPNKGSSEIQELAGVMNEIIDTTRASKQRIVELNERFELTLDAVKDGIWDWDLGSDKTYFSKSWKSMLGYEDNDLQNYGKTFFELLHSNDKTKVESAISKHFENPNKYDYNLQIRLKCKNGTYKWIQSRGKVLLNQNSEPVRMLGYHSDITEQKRNEAYQKQQEEILTEQSRLASMGEMIGNIAHQWRQPLSVISTGVTGMKLEKEFSSLTDESFYNTCDIINENAQYLSKTIDDFRDFIKGNKQKSYFNLNDTINSLIRILKGSIQNHNLDVRLCLSDKIELNGYENQLLQCLINIFNNSKDALHDKDKKIIIIETLKDGDTAIVQIKDNAGGISKQVMPYIFDPYFTTKHKSQGTGLGLHMTHNLIVNGMSGEVKAENITFKEDSIEYQGVMMQVSLPIDGKS